MDLLNKKILYYEMKPDIKFNVRFFHKYFIYLIFNRLWQNKRKKVRIGLLNELMLG